MEVDSGPCKLLLTTCDLSVAKPDPENVTHIKGRLLDQAVILFNCVPFETGTSLKGKNFTARGSKFFP